MQYPAHPHIGSKIFVAVYGKSVVAEPICTAHAWDLLLLLSLLLLLLLLAMTRVVLLVWPGPGHGEDWCHATTADWHNTEHHGGIL